MWSHVLAVALGVLTWTFLEYVIHRWMGHDRRFKKTPFGVEHIRHHIEGNYFAPTYKKVIVAAVVAPLIAAPAIAVAGWVDGVLFVVGFIVFYAMYEMLHRREHTHAGLGWYGRFVRRHHFHHHFVDGRKNHGVTTPLWDFVFGTYQHPTQIKVPRKLCMQWLIDPATGDVHATHAQTYSLR
jgi:sterol desaturase/sphingolipid hydroxylase (fatty acid hydroxylase superfamily)